MVLFHVVLGEVSVSARYVSVSAASTARATLPFGSYVSGSTRQQSAAFVGLSKFARKQTPQQEPAAPVSTSTKIFHSDENDDDSSGLLSASRRHFLGSLATSTFFVSPLASFRNKNFAFAQEASNTTDTVDWDSFGAQLQKSGPTSFPVNGVRSGSDLNEALQDSSKRKIIDPRTHG